MSGPDASAEPAEPVEPGTGPPPRSPSSGPGARRQRVAVYGVCREHPARVTPGRVLLVRAARYLTVAGQWFLPGGGLDHGEEPVQALRREFLEETGLDITAGSLLGILSDLFELPDGTSLHTVRIVHQVATWSGELRDEIGGSSDAARWVTLDEALRLPLRPYVRQVLTGLEA